MSNRRGTRVGTQHYKGGTVFEDAATGFRGNYPQVSFTAEETLQSKLQFERDALAVGIKIKALLL